MLKELKPFCFRNSFIFPNLNSYSICLTCPYVKDCTNSDWDDIDRDNVVAIKTVDDVIRSLDAAATLLENREPTIGTRMEYESIGNMQSKAAGMREAIGMLKKIKK
jgi:hypothetical protein